MPARLRRSHMFRKVLEGYVGGWRTTRQALSSVTSVALQSDSDILIAPKKYSENIIHSAPEENAMGSLDSIVAVMSASAQEWDKQSYARGACERSLRWGPSPPFS
jgi:hypothetical protein